MTLYNLILFQKIPLISVEESFLRTSHQLSRDTLQNREQESSSLTLVPNLFYFMQYTVDNLSDTFRSVIYI